MTERVRGSVTVEHYDVPVFARRNRPERGAGVRLTRIECPPGNISAFIEEFRGSGIPALMDMPGMASAHLLTDTATGRCIVVTTWQDMTALAANRAATARLRADVSENLRLQVRSMEESPCCSPRSVTAIPGRSSSATSSCGMPGTAKAGCRGRTCSGLRR